MPMSWRQRTRIRSSTRTAGAVALALALLSSHAQAAQVNGSHLQLTRSAQANDCPDEDAIAQAVLALLGEEAATSAPLWLAVSVIREDSSYVAYIRVTGHKHGTRTLRARGPGCAALADALAVTLAMILDARADQPIPSQPAPSPPPPSPPPVAVDTEPPPGPKLGGWFSLGGVAATWGMPKDGSWAVIGQVGLAHPPWSGTLGVFWAPTHSHQYGPGTVTVQLFGGLAAGCYRLAGTESALAMGLCLDALVGSLRGEGREYDENDWEARPWVALGGGPALHGVIYGALGWRLRAAFAEPLWHDRFSVQGLGGAAYESDHPAAWVSAHLLATVW